MSFATLTPRERIISSHRARLSLENPNGRAYRDGILKGQTFLDSMPFDDETLDVIARDLYETIRQFECADHYDHKSIMRLSGELAAYYNAGAS